MARIRKNHRTYLAGAKELNAALRRVGDRASGLALKSAAEKGAEVIAEEVRQTAPKDTGKLRESIGIAPHRIRVGQADFHIGVTDRMRVHILRFLELGTKHIAPLGFFRRAIDNKKEEANEVMRQDLRRSLRDVLN